MSLNDYEDALKSFVHDDDKLVTYKWLSKELEIHVNLAKDILKQYWEKYKNKEKILATLLLIGQLKDGSFRVVVVKESDLDSVKQKFLKIDCEHLYSIQKSLPDIELLALVGEGDLRYSAIKCNEEYIRNDDEIDDLRYIGNVRKEENKSMKTSITTNKADEKPVSKKVELSPKEKPKKQAGKKDEVKEKEQTEEKEKEETTATQEKKKSPQNKSSNNLKSNNKTSKKPVQSKQSGFNNLFAKVPNKPQTASSSKSVDSPKDKQISSSITNEKHEKSSPKEAETKLNKEKEKSNKVKDQEREKKETQEKENRHSQSEEKSKKVAKTDEKSKKVAKIDDKSKKVAKTEDKTDKSKPKAKTDIRGKKRNRSQEKNTLSKRKRIVVLDSSEDESGKSENDEEEPMEVEEEPPKVVRKRSPSPPTEKRENGKRMVRKTIDKTFKDEDGFLVTKRVHVYEAVSDSEETEVSTVEPQKPKPMEAPSKKKQTTLMNFFKKS